MNQTPSRTLHNHPFFLKSCVKCEDPKADSQGGGVTEKTHHFIETRIQTKNRK